ncbi:A24 family peptidase [Nocardia sp. NPDC005746]|uniref:A24 family peptidase n=1 Tax=Nocardia sp. NPDC005746 TaxID=3157062 RepID=UPI0033DF931A
MNSTAMLVLTVWCAALSAFDVRERRLPDALTLPGAAVILGYGFAMGTPALAVLGGLMLALPYLVVHLCCPAALGAGDVKLALGLGAATALGGAQTWSWAALAAPILTACVAVGTLVTPTLGTRLPLTPAPACRPGGRRPWSPAAVARSLRRRAGQGIARPVNRAMLRWWREPPHAVPPAAVGRGCGAAGEVATLAHGPAMCAASVVALLAGR